MQKLLLKEKTRRGEDPIERVLMAGFLAGATVSCLPSVAASICPMLNQIASAVEAVRLALLH